MKQDIGVLNEKRKNAAKFQSAPEKERSQKEHANKDIARVKRETARIKAKLEKAQKAAEVDKKKELEVKKKEKELTDKREKTKKQEERNQKAVKAAKEKTEKTKNEKDFKKRVEVEAKAKVKRDEIVAKAKKKLELTGKKRKADELKSKELKNKEQAQKVKKEKETKKEKSEKEKQQKESGAKAKARAVAAEKERKRVAELGAKKIEKAKKTAEKDMKRIAAAKSEKQAKAAKVIEVAAKKKLKEAKDKAERKVKEKAAEKKRKEKSAKEEKKMKELRTKEVKKKKAVAERLGKEKIAAERKSKEKEKERKAEEKKAKANEKSSKITKKKEKTFKHGQGIQRKRESKIPKGLTRGFKAAFWARSNNCNHLSHCRGKIRNRKAGKVFTVSQVNYRSTGGHWSGLDSSYRDHFFARFTGWVVARSNGHYTFTTTSDDGSQVYLDNKLVVNNDGLHGMRTRHGKIHLHKGRHRIRIDFFERGGGAGLHVYWSGPGFGRRLIKSSDVQSTKPPKLPKTRRRRATVTKHKRPGWKAMFWHGVHGLHNIGQAISKISNRAPSKILIAQKINYGSTGGYWHGLNNHYRDNWVARFKGYLHHVPKTGTYTFETISDDGSVLYVNGQRVVNNDGLHGMRTRRGNIRLTEGKKYPIVVDFFERGGGAGCIVKWQGPEVSKRLLTGSYITHENVKMESALSFSRDELKAEVLSAAESAEEDMDESSTAGQVVLKDSPDAGLALDSAGSVLDAATKQK